MEVAIKRKIPLYRVLGFVFGVFFAFVLFRFVSFRLVWLHFVMFEVQAHRTSSRWTATALGKSWAMLIKSPVQQPTPPPSSTPWPTQFEIYWNSVQKFGIQNSEMQSVNGTILYCTPPQPLSDPRTAAASPYLSLSLSLSLLGKYMSGKERTFSILLFVYTDCCCHFCCCLCLCCCLAFDPQKYTQT